MVLGWGTHQSVSLHDKASMHVPFVPGQIVFQTRRKINFIAIKNVDVYYLFTEVSTVQTAGRFPYATVGVRGHHLLVVLCHCFLIVNIPVRFRGSFFFAFSSTSPFPHTF